ncbi:hypothetical protein chiPu_0022001, partial [Chiloscyllium punctatum]|nr:hypothetical protein [Chiloscyllium punctatum]
MPDGPDSVGASAPLAGGRGFLSGGRELARCVGGTRLGARPIASSRRRRRLREPSLRGGVCLGGTRCGARPIRGRDPPVRGRTKATVDPAVTPSRAHSEAERRHGSPAEGVGDKGCWSACLLPARQDSQRRGVRESA